jgi:hypothetical protein
MAALDVALALSTDVVAAWAFYPALWLGRRGRLAALVAALLCIAASPLWVPATLPFGRTLAATFSVAVAVKLYDLYVGAGRGSRPSPRAFVTFVFNLASIVWRKLGDEPRPSTRENLARLARTSLAAASALALVIAVFRADWARSPFLVEHSIKASAFFLALVPTSVALATAWRLGGGEAREPMDNPFAARTPAEFWRRYNRPAQQFLAEDVFRPAGGLRRPVRAALVTFLVSALIHEYLFSIAIGRIQGYQTAFFLVQGIAVVATWRLRPRGGWTVVGILGTTAFNLAASVLFFLSANNVLPFYSRPIGRPDAHPLPGNSSPEAPAGAMIVPATDPGPRANPR